jgi:hypothetical protein
MKNIAKNIALVASVLTVSVVIGCAVLAWTEPTTTPPNGNIAAPLNTGATAQTKAGDLNISGKVGIGTTTPQKTLDVIGQTQATEFCLDGKCCSSWENCMLLAGACMPNGKTCSTDAQCCSSNCASGVCASENTFPGLSGWSYGKPVTVSYSGAPLVNHQVHFITDTQSLIAAGKMKSDCGDMRFKDSDGTTSLSYYIESGCNTTNTLIWVKVPAVPNGDKLIFMFYGNSSVASASNPTYTFIGYWPFNYSSEGWSSSSSAWAWWVGDGNPGGSLIMDGCGGWGDSWYQTYVTLPNEPNIHISYQTRGNGWPYYDGSLRLVVGSLVYGQECSCNPSWELRGPYNISAYAGQSVALTFQHAAGTCCGGGYCNGEHRRVDNVIIRKYVYPEPDCTVGPEVKL